MLSNDDLSKIKKIIREEVGNEVKNASQTLESQIRLSRMQIQNDIASLEDRVKNLEVRTSSVESKAVSIEKKLGKVQKTLDIAIRMFDEADIKLHKRVKKIEEHLGLTSKN